MRKLLALFSICFIFSCGKSTDTLTVKGTIKGLQKGTVYLKRIQDSSIVTIDSLHINGSSDFNLGADITEPELLFLYLNKNTKDDERISFFADKGITTINTTLKNFVFDAEIEGSEQQKILEQYLSMMAKFNGQNLDLVKENFDAIKANDTIASAKTEKALNNLLKRKYLYTANFAVTNSDSEVAPYLALYEIFDVNTSFLDTINNSLSPKVKASKYGKELDVYIKKIKTNNK